MTMSSAARDRPIGFASLLALGINGIVGVGIFFAPASVAAEVPGYSGVFVYLVTAAALFPIAVSYASLGARFPVDGGPYVWARAAFGPSVAFLVGWVTFVSSLFSVTAVVSGLALYASPTFGVVTAAGVRAFAVLSAVLLWVVAATGLQPSARVWTSVTVLKVIPLAVLVVWGLVAFGRSAPAVPVTTRAVTAHSLERAVLVVVFAYQGFEVVPLLAGSVRRSERAVPLATLSALGFAVVLYALLHTLTVRAVPDLAASHAPLVSAARVYGGSFLGDVVAAGTNVSALGIAFGMFNTTPRYLSTLTGRGAFDGWVGELDRRFVPQRALGLTAVAIVVMLLFAGRITELFVLSSLAVLTQYGVTLASLAVLAWRRQNGLSRRHLWPVPLSFAGILLAAQGAELKEGITAAVVVVAGEGLRRAFGYRTVAGRAV